MNVPHFYQSSAQTCGAASLRMIFAALGTTCDETIIAQQCGITPLGCTPQDLVTGATTLGFNAAIMPIYNEPDAIAAMRNDAPLVAMIDLSSLHNQGPLFQWHFVVPLAVANDVVTF